MAVMKRIRKLHLWLGTFFAPSIVFFALTGMLQVMGMHEGDDGDEPAAWIVKLAALHKDQRWVGESRRRPAPALPSAPGPTAASTSAPSAALPAGELRSTPTRPTRAAPSESLKLFFVFMSIGLMVTTGLGVYMAFVFDRNRPLLVGLLVGGTVLPIALLFLG